MNKVGILTFQSSSNFGALLQTYGTYQIVKKMKMKPVVINYCSPNKKDMYKLLNISLKRSVKANYWSLINYPLKKDKREKSDKFRSDFLNIKHPITSSREELLNCQYDFSKVIVGSDQVWNPYNTKFDKSYFLDFVTDATKKIAYAPSFGVSEIEEQFRPEYINLISDFSHLSCREKSGVEIIKNLIGRDVPQVLDPTLLLEKNEWRGQLQNEFPNLFDYVLVYAVGNRRNTLDTAKKIAKKMNKKLVIIPTDGRDYFEKGKTVNPSPLGFVELIDKSTYFVTSSFHGTAFAANLNKEFLVTLDAKEKNNSRQVSLLSSLNLDEALSFDTSTQINKFSERKWQSVNKNLNNLRMNSISYLKKSLA